MKNQTRLFTLILVFLVGCTPPMPREKSAGPEGSSIDDAAIISTIEKMKEKYGEEQAFRIDKGVRQAAAFWREEDGAPDEFTTFCTDNFLATLEEIELVSGRIAIAYESLRGGFNKMSIELKMPLHVPMGEIFPVDQLLGRYSPGAHLNDDMFGNKLAFVVLLNFFYFDLQEKTSLGMEWDGQQWAWVRTAELFTSRTPAAVNQKISTALTESDSYISDYNIYLGKLRNNDGAQLFPEDMRLITHWGIRDELKSNYNNPGGIEKQRMIYQVMLRIINQEIPERVIDNPDMMWDPFNNKVWENGQEIEAGAEPDTRYQYLLANFHAMKSADPYNPFYPDYVSRAFNQYMEIPQADVEALFTELVSSPQVKQVAELISQRLGRPLEPFDIWYDGFKSRSNLNEEELDRITREKYPDAAAFEKDLPNILVKLGFPKDSALVLASRITVDPARGSGHAWGAEMHGEKARLRTRVGPKGMDYKGYNIAIHEFGHNVEQTISLYNVKHYMMHGVPNTAFTEALAFLFQQRDLELLGQSQSDPMKKHLLALDNIWSSFEIMGVSLVDMAVWKWMYAHPDAAAADLKKAVTEIAVDVWNKYYAPVIGVSDSPILAIYSHMIDNPLYLSNYPVGHLIQFQIEEYLEGKDLASEVYRMYSLGLLVPQVWMQRAVGEPISVKPVLHAVDRALEVVR